MCYNLYSYISKYLSILPSKNIDNCEIVRLQFLIGIVHFLEAFFIPKYSNFIKEFSFGKAPLVLVSFLNCRCTDSIILVVYIIFLISVGYLKNTDKLSHLFCQEFMTRGYFLAHFSPSFKSSSSANSLVGA